ncbi:TetR/AcrR family transcriptional regulator [Geomicrobium sediminis]|uniref:AcrR family transcriptional regulator n=1 Tax=Geomicrobium sediminis TaxID=1347788 RepID=A0ABS2PBK8_9BACL|nr:TetR/AcrR family transcriptional regulator [Geomicrobium sediminis]MBM7632376.1 AcrR family transcriptional regulator [Geomicrobium sediminis]
MAPQNKEQLDQKKHERKAQIMRAAIKVFAENGIKLTKISMIAKEAKVSHGLVYHYFTSKDEILYASLDWAVEEHKSAKLFQELNDHEVSPLEQIKQFTLFAFTESDTEISNGVFRIIQNLSSTNDLPEHLVQFVEKAGQFYIESLYPLFVEGQNSGEIIKGDAEELLGIYLTVLSGIMADDPAFWKDNTEQKVGILTRMISER